MDKIEKIKEWIKKQKKEELARNSVGVITGKALFVDADELLAFLDTLSEEPDKGLDVTDFCKPIDPGIAQCVADHWWELLGDKEPDKSLEEAAREYTTTHLRNNEFPPADSAFIAGAKWQKGQDNNFERFKDYTDKALISLEEAREQGRQEMKKQMLKEAVEGRIGAVGLHNSVFIKEPEWAERLDRLNGGDKVRIIIVKED